jgi:nucleoid-associated protein YgaU
MKRTLALTALALALGLTGCRGFGTLGMKKNVDGTGTDAVAKLEATQPAGEKLPEIVALPPASTPPPAPAFAPAPPPAFAPTTAMAASAPETTAVKARAWEEEIVLPPKRKPKKAPEAGASKAAPKSAAGPHAKTYVVQRGDTLQKISMKFFGTTRYWSKIFEANRSKMKKPDVVIAGMVLTIP